ncbi:uncharacterized protein BO66DRAFT_179045 [Aspergillus aculeatinus CBS 121060]|uniref:Uncharacterized protein n=1 Tax=Aspergillus aculeatinus CBS 121060 TaxID=1448322 RepID=A0ACD1HKX5_9EURO|nr:hypothetical protein BO66DRAFT_179045 [Aspergillus aculeatinus CBS 121060]RAH74052.1 hypothetical protein BO66DRAFT_179045 [Aspergillus aculeatinus CBS 121060]
MGVSHFVHRPNWTNSRLQDRLCSISLDSLGLDPLVLLLFISSIVYRRHGEPRVFVSPSIFSPCISCLDFTSSICLLVHVSICDYSLCICDPFFGWVAWVFSSVLAVFLSAMNTSSVFDLFLAYLEFLPGGRDPPQKMCFVLYK